MIGKVITSNGQELTLLDNSQFLSSNAKLVFLANLELERYRRNWSPARGPFGPELLYHLAKLLNGKVVLEEKPAGPSDAIY